MADYKLPVITGTSLSTGDLLRWSGSGWANQADSIYLHADGSIALAGAWDMGNQILTNVNIDTGDIADAVTHSQWDAAYTHITSDGSDHSFIDQDVTSSGTPTFGGIIIAEDGTIGQAAGPLLTFDDSGNILNVAGCNTGFQVSSPNYVIEAKDNIAIYTSNDSAGVTYLRMSTSASTSDGAAVIKVTKEGLIHSNIQFQTRWGGGLATTLSLRGTGSIGLNESDPVSSVEHSHPTPAFTIHNTSASDGDGARNCSLAFRGHQSGGEESVLGTLVFRHDGSGDDEKGVFRLDTNDGNDGTVPTNRLTIDSAGIWSIKGTGELVGINEENPEAQLHISRGWNSATMILGAFMNSEDQCGTITLRKAWDTPSAPALVQDGSNLGRIFFSGYDGSGYHSGAEILGRVDGTPSDGTDMPTELLFYTCPDGSATLAERMVIKASGYVGLNNNTPDTLFEMAKESADCVFTISTYHDTEATASIIDLRKSDNTEASPALVDDNAVLGILRFSGHDGSGWHEGARIEARIDGTPSDGTDMPTELTFWTTPDAAGSPIERMSIDPLGNIELSSDTSGSGLNIDVINTSEDANSSATLFLKTGTQSGFELVKYGPAGFGGVRQNELIINNYDATSLTLTVGNFTNSVVLNTTDLDIENEVNIHKDSADAKLSLSCYHDTEATASIITLRKADGSEAVPALVDDDAVLGVINFSGHDGAGWHVGAKIEARIDGTPSLGTDMPAELTFWTTPEASATPVQRVTIDPDGYVGIGIAIPSYNVHVFGPVDTYIKVESDTSHAGVFVDRSSNTSMAAFFGFQTAGSTVFQIGISDATSAFYVAGSGFTTKYMTIETSGNVGIGTITPDTLFEISKESADTELTISCYHDTEATTPIITLRKADNTEASPALIDDNAVLGTLSFQGHDGSGWHEGARIEARIDGTPSDGTDMPTELTFWTTPDASATPVQRVTIDPDGYVGIGITTGLDGQLHIDQSSATGAKPVLTLDQADVSEQFIKLIGTSAADNTQSLVDAADLTTPGAIVGWFKVEIQDDAGAGAITDGTYYVPFYATPTA